jgi:hypothetical protein
VDDASGSAVHGSRSAAFHGCLVGKPDCAVGSVGAGRRPRPGTDAVVDSNGAGHAFAAALLAACLGGLDHGSRLCQGAIAVAYAGTRHVDGDAFIDAAMLAAAYRSHVAVDQRQSGQPVHQPIPSCAQLSKGKWFHLAQRPGAHICYSDTLVVDVDNCHFRKLPLNLPLAGPSS